MIKTLKQLMLLLALVPAAALARTDVGASTQTFSAAEAENADAAAEVALTTPADVEMVKAVKPVPFDSTAYGRSLKRRKIERVNRDDLKATFIPKGQFMFGGTVNFQEYDDDNINMLVLKNMNYEGHTFSLSPSVGYFVANNLAVGARYSYNRNYFYLGQFDLNLGEDFNISLSDLYYLGHTHKGSVFLRNYVPLGRSRVFAFFSEIAATYAQTNAKNSTGKGEDYDGSYEVSHAVQLGFTPGLTAFFTNFAAAEVSIGVMGLNYKWGDMKTNQIESGRTRSGGANFKINLFSINIGMIFYL